MIDQQITYYNLYQQTNFPEYQGPEKIVIRRYNDFVWLHDRLFEKYKGIFIPSLPEKNAVGKKFTSFPFHHMFHYFEAGVAK